MFRADAGSSPPDVGCELLSCDLHQAYPCVALHRFFYRRVDPSQVLGASYVCRQTYRARCVTLVSAMAESSSSGLTRMLDSIGKHSGFREWKINLSQAINFHSPELLTVLEGGERPTATEANAEAVAAWDKANGRLYSLLFFTTSGSAKLTVRTKEGTETNSKGDGRAAWNCLLYTSPSPRD